MPSRTDSARRGSFAFTAIVALTIVVAAGAAIIYYRFSNTEDETASLITHTVDRANFRHVVLEQGDVESSENIEVVCQVKSRNRDGTAILWVIEEGSKVKKGDKLVELDSSALEQEIKQQRIVVNTSEAVKISAKSTLDQAEIAKEEYLKGQFIQDEQTFLSEILIAEETLSRAQEQARFSEELTAQGFQTQISLKADKFAAQKAQVELDLAQNKLDTLRQITKRKMLIGFDADIEAARAKHDAEQKSYEEEIDKLKELEEQMELCVIYAPQDGQVVHANRFSSRGGSAEFVVEPGALVRERQEIIRLPDVDKMQVKAKINESKVNLVTPGMPATIQIGAYSLDGEVIKVNKYAEPTGYWSSQVKEFATLIRILDPPEEVRTGMTAEVQIFVREMDNVVQIPVQGVLPYRGHHFCLVNKSGKLDTKEVKIGPSDDKVVVIESGVDVGEVIVMNPRSHEDLMELPNLPEVEEKDSRNRGGRRGGGPPGAGGRRPGGGPPGAGGRPGGGPPGAGGRPGGGPPKGQGAPNANKSAQAESPSTGDKESGPSEQTAAKDGDASNKSPQQGVSGASVEESSGGGE